MIQSAPDVSWIVQTDGLIVVFGALRRTIKLSYPEAAIWDLLSRNRLDAVVRKMTYIAGIDLVAAQALVEDSVEKWIGLGLLIREVEHG